MKVRYKQMHDSDTRSRGETVSQQTFNLHVHGSNPCGTTLVQPL